MSTQAKEKCPLCLEDMDLTDKQLKPCKCGYEICLWCWHHIMEMDQKDECGGRCPGCRTIYNKDRILGTGISNQILKELCADKSNLQKEQSKSQKQKSSKVQLRVAEEPKDPNSVRVIQRKLVYIVGMPSEFASVKVLRQKTFLGQYGKIENIIIDNIGANQQIPDSGRVYVTFSREEEAVRCIEAVHGYILDGRPLKATFGVTRYCHIWLSNKVCRKPNCSYVHHKAAAEDICSKDEVSVVCARLQHLLGMDMKGPQQRAGSTLPPPGDCNSRTTICSGNSKDNTCTNDGRVLPNGGNKNPCTLSAATPRDSSLCSGSSSSIINAVHQLNNHESMLSSHRISSDSKSQELPPLGGRNCSSIKEITASVTHMQLSDDPIEGTLLRSSQNVNVVSQGPKDSNDAKSQASAQLGNGTSNSKQMTSVENGTIATSLRKPQYVNVVSQGSGRRFTVLTRQLPSTDTRPKATGQVDNGISNSKKLTLVKNEKCDSITVPRCQNVNQVSQKPEEPSHMLANRLASIVVKSRSGAQEKSGCSDINGKPVPGNHTQLSESMATHSSTASQSLCGSPTVLSNLSTSDVKSQASLGPDKLSDSRRKLASENQLQLLNQQKAAVLLPRSQFSTADIVSASECRSIANDQVSSTGGKYQTAQGGNHCLHNREMTLSGDQISSQHVESILLPRPFSAISSTEMVAQDIEGSNLKGIMVNSLLSESSCLVPMVTCSPGFKEPIHSSDSDKVVSVSSPTCSALCCTSDALVQEDSCGIADQSDIISWVSECLEDDGDAAQSNSVSISSSLSSADTIWRCTRFPGSCFSGASNHHLLSSYPSGLLHCMGGVENTMRCCCAFPPVSNMSNQKPEYWNGTANSYMSTGGYDAFYQNTTSSMKGAVVGTLLQQPSQSSLYHDWTNGNSDSSLKSAQVDISYRMYSLF